MNEQGISLGVKYDNVQIFDNIIAKNNLSIKFGKLLREDIYANNQYFNNSNHYEIDTDGDGIVDDYDDDIDGDGVLNEDDEYPFDPHEWNDLDGDGIGDNSDEDIDGDGQFNIDDDFPFDPDETNDMDGDGIGDNRDIDNNNNFIPDIIEIPLIVSIFIILIIIIIFFNKRNKLRGNQS